METQTLREVIGVVRAEERRREDELQFRAKGLPLEYRDDYWCNEWLCVDGPFLHELYLMVLVALRHEVERELVRVAAQMTGEQEITVEQYRANLQTEQRELRQNGERKWKKLAKKLKLEACHGYESMQALRLLANSYKHSPFLEPGKELLELLNLSTGVNYSSLPESGALREALGRLISLREGVAFSEIAERFLDEASSFLESVRQNVTLSPIRSRPVSLDPKDFLH